MSTLEKVKELREITGAGMQDCKTALSENNNNIEQAVDFLRKKGILKAAKKSSRDAAEGLVATFISNKAGILIEINSETDFVAKNKEFINFCEEVAKKSLEANTTDDLKTLKINQKETIEQAITKLISKIGENIKIRKFEKIISDGFIARYLHNKASDSTGKIGVLLSYKTDNEEIAKELAMNICMHIAALNPMSIGEKGIDNNFIEKERKIIIEQLKDEKKPSDILKKIIDGKISKIISENTLLKQKWVIDQDITVEKAIESFSKSHKIQFKITNFKRLKVGEGIVTNKSNFTEEVKNLAQ